VKKLIHFVLYLLFLSSNQSAYAQSSSRFSESLSSLPKKIEKKMKTVTWRKRYPLSLDKLSYLQVAHWGFDHKIHEGGLIVQKDVAKEVLSIFKEVFEKKISNRKNGASI